MYRRQLYLVFALVVILSLLFAGRAFAAPPSHAGEGHPPVVVNENNDPDEDGNGPDRYVDHDSTDWNNGCQGGWQWGEEDDNEGVCGKRPLVKIEKAVTKKAASCKLVLWGETPEVFNGWVDVRNPANEKYVLGESNGYLEITLSPGEYNILWWSAFWGHAESPITHFTCVAEETTIIEEPALRPWFNSPPNMRWRVR